MILSRAKANSCLQGPENERSEKDLSESHWLASTPMNGMSRTTFEQSALMYTSKTRELRNGTSWQNLTQPSQPGIVELGDGNG